MYMSSWIQYTQDKTLSYKQLYCKTTTSGFGSNFFNFFMCYLYAKSKNKILYLNDMKNSISDKYHLILDTFNESPNIRFTLNNGRTIQQQEPVELNKFYQSLDTDFLKSEAKKIFKIKPELDSKIRLLLKDLPQFDMCVHIRTGDKITTGEMRPVKLESYTSEILVIQEKYSLPKIYIYLMTDSTDVIKKFKEAAHSSWSVYTLALPIIGSNGHIQKDFNAQPVVVKMDAFIHFLAELKIAQTCPYVVCTFSSNIGRFIKYTGDYVEIKSLDS